MKFLVEKSTFRLRLTQICDISTLQSIQGFLRELGFSINHEELPPASLLLLLLIGTRVSVPASGN
jgi:hypothetical protein